MRKIHLAALTALVMGATSAPSYAGLLLLAGPDQGISSTNSANNYGFTGTYNDLRGAGGASENVAHPGGGPVAFLYVFGNNGAVSTYFDSTAGPYDGADDTQVGVLNLSSQKLMSFSVSSTTDVFAFDGDGINSFGAPGNSSDTTGYGGPLAFFTSINRADTSGTINFVGGVAANGGTTYFSLEEAPTIATAPNPAPEPSSLVMVGCGISMAFGYVRHKRRAVPVVSE